MQCAGSSLASYRQMAMKKYFRRKILTCVFVPVYCSWSSTVVKRNEDISAYFPAFWPYSLFNRAVLGLRLCLKVKVRVGFRLLIRLIKCFIFVIVNLDDHIGLFQARLHNEKGH